MFFGVIDHQEDTSAVYVIPEIYGPKNTEHTVSYLLHYIKSSGNVPEWVMCIHLYMDNAGSTNKIFYTMAWTQELVQQNFLQYIRISFMIAGHTKFAVDRLFSRIAQSYNKSDIFNVEELADMIRQHATVFIENGTIVHTWHTCLGQKYSNLLGIRDLHDFFILRSPGSNNVIF